MTENFRESLKYEIKGKNALEEEEKKAIEEEKKALDAYRSFVAENMPRYILFMEGINQVVTELEDKKVIGKTEIKSRVKAIRSAIKNSKEKELDDIFGFNIVTQNEREKEILMLIIHNLFVERYVYEKEYDKSNGYKAHHCIGAVKKSVSSKEIENLTNHILNAKTNKPKQIYRDSSTKAQKEFGTKEVFDKVYRYPILREEILRNGELDDSIKQAFLNAILFLDSYLLPETETRREIPILEIQFKTKEVEQEATCGRAKHMDYKKINPEQIKERYKNRQLVRGVDFPFRFFRDEATREMKLESANETLTCMWPFLEETIEEYKKTGVTNLASYDMHMAKIFPDLQPYVKAIEKEDPTIPIKNTDSNSVWQLLKEQIIEGTLCLQENTKEKGDAR